MAWSRKKRLEMISDEMATPEVADIFSDIRYSLGLLFTPSYYQALAYYPKFLEAHWTAIRPIVRTATFFQHADRIRAEAYTTVHNYFNIPYLCRCTQEEQLSDGARRELAMAADHFCYREAVILLICALQSQAFDGAGASPSPTPALAAQPPVPPNLDLVIVPEQTVAPRIRILFDEIRRTIELPVVTNDYYALARWPDFLVDFWKALKPNARSILYSESRRRIIDSAMQHATSLPDLPSLGVQALHDAGLDPSKLASIVSINEAFTDTFCSNLINVSFAHIGLEGGNGRSHDVDRAA